MEKERRSLLPRRLRELRRNLGLGLKDVAEVMGMKSLATISRWEDEDRPQEPANEVLLDLADFYGVSLDYLFGRPGAEKDSPAVRALKVSLRAQTASLSGTAQQRVASVWALANQLAPGILNERRVAAALGMSVAGFREALAGEMAMRRQTVADLAELLDIPVQSLWP